jgi:hypothetical protein
VSALANEREEAEVRRIGEQIIGLLKPLIEHAHPVGSPGWSQNLGEIVLQAALAGIEADPVQLPDFFVGLGITIGSYSGQLPAAVQTSPMDAIVLGVSLGIADFNAAMRPKGNA